VQEAFKQGSIKSFARHSRLGYTNLNTVDEVKKDFMDQVNYLRKLGYKRISLKTGSYGMEALAMSIKFASEAKLDLLTIDGSGGGKWIWLLPEDLSEKIMFSSPFLLELLSLNWSVWDDQS